MTIDTDALLAANDIVTIAAHYTQLKKKGAEFVGRCLWHSPDANPSMWVVPKKQMAYCFACGEGGNVIDVVMQAEGLDFKAACARLNGSAPPEGWKPRVAPEPKREAPARVTSKPPAPATDKQFVHRDFGAPDHIIPFRDAAGDVLGYECRWEREDGKESRMLTFGQRGDKPARWEWGHFTHPRPLYGLDTLAAMSNAQVLAFEGPIKARAAQEIFPHHACIAWSGGAKSWHRHDWTPVAGRKVVVWPDNDTPGIEAGERLAALLADPKGLCCTVKLVDTNRMPESWDVRDALAEGWDFERLIAWLRERAKPIVPQGTSLSGIQDTSDAVAGAGSALPKPSTPTPPSPELPSAAPDSLLTAVPSGQAVQQRDEGGTIPEDAPQAAVDEALASVVPHTAAAPASPTRKRRKPALATIDGNTVHQPDPEDDTKPFPLSPDALADAFAVQHGEDWRYVREWDRWLTWQGDTWEQDKTDLAFQRAREVCRGACYWPEAASLTADARRKLTHRSYIGGVAYLAARDRRIASRVEDWDTDPLMLGVPGGVVDLRLGRLIEGAREQMISRKAVAAPEPGDCPLWLSIIDRAARGDDSMRAYLQRVAGYMATGETREECFFVVYGPGASGKSTFARVLMDCLGSYAQGASFDTFMHRDKSEHLTEIARMSGARLIGATEGEEGARLNEARIKTLTGRDKVSARFMRGDLFDFQPTAKILLVSNHKPALRSVGEEMRRRIHMIEFPDTIPEEERDREMPEKLRAEYPAIVAWIVRGARDWIDCGLGKPERVEDATREYLAGEDTMGEWISERTAAETGGRTASGDAYRDYKAWCEKGGEYVISQKRFVQRLVDRGYRTIKSGVRYIEGLRLREATPQRADPYS